MELHVLFRIRLVRKNAYIFESESSEQADMGGQKCLVKKNLI